MNQGNLVDQPQGGPSMGQFADIYREATSLPPSLEDQQAKQASADVDKQKQLAIAMERGLWLNSNVSKNLINELETLQAHLNNCLITMAIQFPQRLPMVVAEKSAIERVLKLIKGEITSYANQ